MSATLTNMSEGPSIKTTTVGSFSQIDWIYTLPSEQTVRDATRVVIGLQRDAGIDLPTDGELYRYDISHPDTNGMIEYFISRIGGIDTRIGVSDAKDYSQKQEMSIRRQPAGVVWGALT